MYNKPWEYELDQYHRQETLRKAALYRLWQHPHKHGWLRGLWMRPDR